MGHIKWKRITVPKKGPFAFFGKPGVPAIDAWVDRCVARPGVQFAAVYDAERRKA